MIWLVRVITIALFFAGIPAISVGSEERVGDLFITQLSERIQALEERVTELEYGLNHAPIPPRIAYDSGWRSLSPNSSETLHHNVGGNVNRYIVLIDARDTDTEEWYNWGYGIVFQGETTKGFYYYGLNGSDVTIVNEEETYTLDLRLRIIVY